MIRTPLANKPTSTLVAKSCVVFKPLEPLEAHVDTMGPILFSFTSARLSHRVKSKDCDYFQRMGAEECRGSDHGFESRPKSRVVSTLVGQFIASVWIYPDKIQGFACGNI